MKQVLIGDVKTMFMFLGYTYGHYLNKDDISRSMSRLMTQRAIDNSINRLVGNGLVKPLYRGYYSNYFQLTQGHLFEALSLLLQPENATTFTAIKKAVARDLDIGSPKDYVHYALLLLQGRNVATLKVPTSGFFTIELSYIFTNKNYRQVFDALPDSLIMSCITSILDDKAESDRYIDWDYMRQLVMDDRKDKKPSAATAEMQSAFNLYYYLGTGEMCIDLEHAHADMYALITAAILTMYKGNPETAYKLFAKAITLSNKRSTTKGYFSSIILNYYYIVCLLLCDNDTTRKKLETLEKKKYLTSSTFGNLLFMALFVYFHNHESPRVNSRGVEAIYRVSSRYACMWLGWMIYNRLMVWPKKVKEPSLTEHQPCWAWLRAELMPSGVVPRNDEMAQKVGSSLFYHLNVKPVWEMRLEAIINENTPNGDAKAAAQEPDEKLIYLLEYSIIVPIVKKRRKDGSWSTGRRLSVTALRRLTDKYLDDIDKRFIKGVNEWDYNIYVDSHINDLVGCDHVFTGTQVDLVPVAVHEDKPFLIINKDKDESFSITTNVDELKNDNTNGVICKKNSETDYSVYQPSSFERKVYKQILMQEHYPKEAEPLLMKLISTLGGKTEIHSNMVVDLDDLEKVNGTTKLTLRCVPDRYDTYNISVSVHAFPGLNFVPGKGNITTIAEQNGKKVQVVRHLRAERKNLKQLSLALADIGVIEEDEDWQPDAITDSLTLYISSFLDLLQWVKDNGNVCEMEWPEGTRVKYHPAVKASAASIGFKAKNGWFDVEGDVKINDDEVISLQKLLEMMRESGKSRYIKIGDSEYISLSSDLSKILRRLDTVTSEKRNHLQMSTAAVGLIGDVLDNQDANVSHSKAMDELRQRIAKSADLQPTVPRTLHATMRDYQEEGYEWMERVTSWGGGVCLADDMGLGKTLQTIAMLLDKEADGPSLVVAPASVVPNWRNELQRFAPTLSVTILNSAEDREEAIKGAEAGEIVVSTYALLNIQQEQLATKEWNIICLDEAHTIKNPNTKMSKAAMTLQAKRKVILTGTPIQNHLSELWNLFQFINPGLLGSAEQFSKKFIEPIEVDHNKDRQNQLRRLISPFLLRRTKGEVIEELPEKNEINVPVELTDEEMTMYEVHRRQAERSVLADKTVKVSTLAEITKLREMACSVSLVDKKWKRPSSKVLAFIDLAESLNDSGNRALVFSQFTSFFDQIRAAMDKAKLPYLYLDGSTPMAQREKLVKDFQTGKCPFFLISLKAGGLGLNLTGANYVIHLDPWWNPAIEQQATDRAYRIGQKQDVTVYHLITQHTIEEKIQRLHKTKRDLADSLLEGTDMSHALTQEELLELLK